MQIRLTGREATSNLTGASEHLNQVQLIEEIVLVPEDELVVRRMFVDDLTPALQLGDGVRQSMLIRRPGQMTSANLEQLLIGHVPGHWTFVQRVRPD